MNWRGLCVGALAGTAAVTLAAGGGSAAFASSSTGAMNYRYSDCGPDISDPAAQVCENGHGVANVVQGPNGTFVLTTHDSSDYTYTSSDIGTYTATTRGSFTYVLTADQVHGVFRFSDRQVFSQTDFPTCIATDNFVLANGQVRHNSSTYDCG